MKHFRVTYEDPETGNIKHVECSFEDTPSTQAVPSVSAEEWAEDYAYMLADKGPHTVEEIQTRTDNVQP
jgi:hypothetical protein